MSRPNVNPRGPAQRYPGSSEPITGDPKSVDQNHQNSDLNSSIFAQHHTLGSGPNQSSPGNHNHDGSTSKQLLVTAIKTAEPAISNNAVVADDAELFLPLKGQTTYMLDGFLMWISNDVADIQFVWRFDTGGIIHWGAIGPDDVDLSVAGTTRSKGEWFAQWNRSSPTPKIQYAGSSATLTGRMGGTLTTINDGTLWLQWAQNTATVVNTFIRIGSWISARGIS